MTPDQQLHLAALLADLYSQVRHDAVRIKDLEARLAATEGTLSPSE